MYAVYEEFESDKKRFLLHEHEDKFECEVWLENHRDCTTALRIGRSHLIIERSR